ncbi:MAG TPA: plastocyanin/azurin family copper-binding protein [Kofleriaceae bacterium]|nr:plastocyanin/azurin family copper-binding protein [Kofleriaceae bacterium]
MRKFALAFVALAACSSDNGGTSVDAPSSSKVATVDCAANPPNATITAMGTATDGSDGKFMPMSVSIPQGQVVQFVTTALHNVAPNTGTDPGVSVGFSETKCIRFTMPGTYAFHCSPHGFQGSVVVN